MQHKPKRLRSIVSVSNVASATTNVHCRMSHARPLIADQSVISETLMYIIGVGAVWIFIGTALFWLQPYALTPLGYGTALAVSFIPAIIAVGGHELAHERVADDYCGYDAEFKAFVSTTQLTLASVGGLLLVVALETFGVVSLPKWVVLFGVASPGAVVISGRNTRCNDEAAIAGPLFNFMIGAGIWFMNGDIGILPIFAPFEHQVIWLIGLLSLYLAFVNSLPIGPLDGNKVWRAKDPTTLVPWAVVIVGSIAILYTSLL